MIYNTKELAKRYLKYAQPRNKIFRDIKSGKLIPLVRGIYEDDPNANPECLGGYIYGPSYLSFDYVLSMYSIIPEAVYGFTYATHDKRRHKVYHNHYGYFYYQDVPKEVFELGLEQINYKGYSYLIATKEKALCDKLYSLSPVRSMKWFKALLFEDLRIEEEDLENMNHQLIFQIAPKYHSTNLNLLMRYIKEEFKYA